MTIRKMPDGTLLPYRELASPGPRVVVFTDIGEGIDHPRWRALLEELAGMHVQVVAVRDPWTLQGQWQDLQWWITHARHPVCVASGSTAALLLRLEDQAHLLEPSLRPALPDGLVLREPAAGDALLAAGFTQGPVRVQTPTVIIGASRYPVTGNVRSIMLPAATHALQVRAEAKLIAQEIDAIRAAERPIRFTRR